MLQLSNRIAKCVVHTGCLGSRIVYVRIRAKLSVRNWRIYIPRCNRSNPSTVDILDQLECVLEKVSTRDCIFVIDDFNCKLSRSVAGITKR